MKQADYFLEVKMISARLFKQRGELDKITEMISKLKGRLFILGVGGSAANASHAVNDFRKIAGIEAYTPTDNVAELTARTNDDGWETTFDQYLITSKLNKDDVMLVLSVGGGSGETSQNIMFALNYATNVKCKVIGIVGPKGGLTADIADLCIKIPAEKYITPMVESFQQVIWHYIVNTL